MTILQSRKHKIFEQCWLSLNAAAFFDGGNIMKTLYISDLDGTLLNADASLSSETAQRLNSLIDRGLNFTVATARTQATVVPMLSKLKLKLPVVLMNGAAVYDIENQKYVYTATFGKESAQYIAKTAEKYSVNGFCYNIKDNKLHTFYDNLATDAMRDFYNERVEKYKKEFTKVNNLHDAADDSTVYFCFMNTREKLENLCNEFVGSSSIKYEFYPDIYDENNYFLELLSVEASKKSGALTVKNFIVADKLIGFGDNLNDIPLFQACNECYAVENAKPELKEIATGVIGSNTENGVVKFLENVPLIHR
jgi:hypothetical protein